jgi:hypothetical protein
MNIIPKIKRNSIKKCFFNLKLRVNFTMAVLNVVMP